MFNAPSRPALKLAVALLLILGLCQVPNDEAAAEGAAPPVADARSAPDGATAVKTALSYGHDVVDDSKTTPTQQVFAQGDGNFRLESSSEPVRVRRGSSWTPVNLNLTRSADGGWVPQASPTAVRFSGGGASDLAALRGPDGTWTAQSWKAGVLAPPLINGDTATYRNVYPGVDLKMTATVSGFSQVLVVASPAAAKAPGLRSVRLGIASAARQDAVPRGGGMDLTSKFGAGLHVGAATWWDSTAPDATYRDPGGTGSDHEVAATLSPSLIQLDTSGVTGRSDIKYPLFIDPSYSWTGGINGGTAYTYVDKSYPTTSYWNGGHPDHYQRVGYVSASFGGPDTTRSFWRMNTNGVAGKHILAAEFNTFEVWASSCSARQVELWQTSGINSGTTWNSPPSWTTKLGSANFAYGWSSSGIGGTSSCSTGGRAVGFAASTPAIQSVAKAKLPYMTLGLRATSETDTYAWKKFRAAATLVVTYNSYPDPPTNLRTSSSDPCITGAGRPVVGKLPTLYATASDNADKGNVAVKFEWWIAGGSKVGEATSAFAASGSSSFAATIPSTAFSTGQDLAWHAKTYDGTDYSAYSAWCELHLDLDTVAPTKPTVTSTDFPDYEYFRNNNIDPPTPPRTAGDSGIIQLSSTDTSATTYYVSVNGRPATAYPATSGPLSLTINPGLPSSWVDVYTVDAVNNKSGVVNYAFPLKTNSVLKAQWKISGTEQLADGTWHSASAPDIPFTPAENGSVTSSTFDGVTITDNNAGPVADTDDLGIFQFHTDGVNDYAATAGPVVDTSQSYTVVAKVRPADDTRGTYQTVASQGGTSDSAYYLQFGPTGAIRFAITDADASTRGTYTATAYPADILDASKCGVQLQNTDPTQGNYYDPSAWHTIVGVYDRSDNQVQIWVEGCSRPVGQVSGPAAPKNVWNATGTMLLGTARYTGVPVGSNMYGGGIHDVLVYSGAATSAQIQDQLGVGNV